MKRYIYIYIYIYIYMYTCLYIFEFDHQKRYARAQSFAKAIWSSWIKDYVPVLNRRSNSLTPAEQHLKTGDLVWLIEETYPSALTLTLGLVNSVVVQTSSQAPQLCARPPYCSSNRLLNWQSFTQNLLCRKILRSNYKASKF